MKLIITALVAVLALAVVGVAPATASEVRSTCNDVGYLDSAIKASNKYIAALRLAQRERFSSALVPARKGLWIIKHSAVPCDEGYDDLWLHRQYSIKYAVALVRWLEECKQGDWDSADIYWSSVEFWGEQITDITYAW